MIMTEIGSFLRARTLMGTSTSLLLGITRVGIGKGSFSIKTAGLMGLPEDYWEQEFMGPFARAVS